MFMPRRLATDEQTCPASSFFSFHSTAPEIIEGINLTGKRAIVTGGASIA